MPDVAGEINSTLDASPARFVPGDMVVVRFANDPNLDQTLPVDLEGNVSFLMLGQVRVLGKNPEQVRQELVRAYSGKLTSTDISVNLGGPGLEDAGNSTFRTLHVLGEVRSPGAIPTLGRRLTLVEALARAGGFDKRSALLKQVLLVRWMPEQNTYLSWKIDARPEYWDDAKQVLLQAHDVVYVPNTPIDEVNIWVDKYIRQMIPFPYLMLPAQSTP